MESDVTLWSRIKFWFAQLDPFDLTFPESLPPAQEELDGTDMHQVSPGAACPSSPEHEP